MEIMELLDIRLTPFSLADVAFILKMPNERIQNAINTGMLCKSACFSERSETNFCFPSFVDLFEFSFFHTISNCMLREISQREFASYATDLICEYLDFRNFNSTYPFTDAEAIVFLSIELESYLIKNRDRTTVSADLVFSWNNLINLSIKRIVQNV